MPCDTYRQPEQTITQRKEQIRDTIDQLAKDLIAGRVKPVVGPNGAIAFQGFTSSGGVISSPLLQRNNVTDNCAYRRIMVQGSAAAKMAIFRAEKLAGRSVSKQTVAAGVHSHDGGSTWHGKG